jgi:pyridoxine kinase
VVATGVPDGDHLAVIAVTADATLIARSPWHDRAFFGTGDLFAGLFLSHWLEHRTARKALARTVAGLEVVTAATQAAGSVDLALIANLAAIIGALPAEVGQIG